MQEVMAHTSLASTLTVVSCLLALAQARLLPLDPPTLVVSDARTEVAVGLQVMSGESGTPGGFTIQWMTAQAFRDNGDTWYHDNDVRLCKASYAPASDYKGSMTTMHVLRRGESIPVKIGDDTQDLGAAIACGPYHVHECDPTATLDTNPQAYYACQCEDGTLRSPTADGLDTQAQEVNCAGGLDCGTEYVFRVFANGVPGGQARSSYSPNVVASTTACAGATGCTYTQGYWRTHCTMARIAEVCKRGPGGTPTCAPRRVPYCRAGNSHDYAWPATSLILGDVEYSDVELVQILQQPPQGNHLVALAHQLIAAKLNIANGAGVDMSLTLDGHFYGTIVGLVNAADKLIAAGTTSLVYAADGLVETNNMRIPPVGNALLVTPDVEAFTEALREYNEGNSGGPGHCPGHELPQNGWRD